MSDFTIVNLKDDVEDSVGAVAPGIEGRFSRKHLDSEHLGVSYFRYEPNRQSTKGHRHRSQEEAYVVVSGSGRIKVGDEIRDLRQWDVVRLAPTAVRAIESGPDGLELICVGSDRPEGGDGEMTDVSWED